MHTLLWYVVPQYQNISKCLKMKPTVFMTQVLRKCMHICINVLNGYVTSFTKHIMHLQYIV